MRRSYGRRAASGRAAARLGRRGRPGHLRVPWTRATGARSVARACSSDSIPALVAALAARRRGRVRRGVRRRRRRRRARACPTSSRRSPASWRRRAGRGQPEYRLGFRSAVRNVGAGPLIIDGHRAGVDTARWSPTRSIVRDGAPREAGARRRPAALRRLARPSPLAPAAASSATSSAGPAARVALVDGPQDRLLPRRPLRRRAGPPAGRARRARVPRAAAASSRPGCSASARGSPSATATTTRRTSKASTCRSTGLADGRYVLVHRVNREPPDPRDRHGNNAASVLLALRWRLGVPYVRVLARCPGQRGAARAPPIATGDRDDRSRLPRPVRSVAGRRPTATRWRPHGARSPTVRAARRARGAAPRRRARHALAARPASRRRVPPPASRHVVPAPVARPPAPARVIRRARARPAPRAPRPARAAARARSPSAEPAAHRARRAERAAGASASPCSTCRRARAPRRACGCPRRPAGTRPAARAATASASSRSTPRAALAAASTRPAAALVRAATRPPIARSRRRDEPPAEAACSSCTRSTAARRC